MYTFHLFLDLVGLSTYSSVSSILYSVGQTVGVVIPIVLMTVGSDVMNLRSTSDENILIYIVMSRTFIAALHLVTSMIVVSCSTWLERGYIRGIFDLPMKVSCSQQKRARQVIFDDSVTYRTELYTSTLRISFPFLYTSTCTFLEL